MNAVTLQTALVSFCQRARFRHFLIELNSGDRIRITHPEALAFRGNILVYQSPKGPDHLFDSSSVCQLLALPAA